MSPSDGTRYPVDFESERPGRYSRFLPLIKWLLVLPHLLAIGVLLAAAFFVAAASFLGTLVTGRYPRPLWYFMAGVHRWTHRVLAYQLLITDRYPPFTLSETPRDTCWLRADRPERVARWRPLLAWVLILPYGFVASILAAVAQIASLAAIFTILFTREIPGPLYRLILNALSWQNRASFYGLWMSTRYPPFEWQR